MPAFVPVSRAVARLRTQSGVHAILLEKEGDPEDRGYDERGGVAQQCIKTRRSVPTDEAAIKLLYLALQRYRPVGHDSMLEGSDGPR